MTRSAEAEALASRAAYLAKSLAGRKALFKYARNTSNSPGLISPSMTNRAPNHNTSAVAKAINTSTVRSSLADSRCPFRSSC